jgi:hypothetical protein
MGGGLYDSGMRQCSWFIHLGKVRGIELVRCTKSLMKDRSVHNICIERLWVEVKWIIVTKWKPFFGGLEAHHGLRVDSATHIWLLHHLFLESLNNDIQEWAEHWNAHGMRLKREKDKVPRDMFILGMRRRVLDDAIVRQENSINTEPLWLV